ncbi:MAG: hypothetical protein AAF995_04395 [Planctomycetota bacterium]
MMLHKHHAPGDILGQLVLPTSQVLRREPSKQLDCLDLVFNDKALRHIVDSIVAKPIQRRMRTRYIRGLTSIAPPSIEDLRVAPPLNVTP